MSTSNKVILLPITFNNDILKLYKQIFIHSEMNNDDIVNMANGFYKERAQWFALYSNHQLVGFCTVTVINPFSAFIYNVGIIEKERRKGYASKLLRSIIDIFGSINIYLFVKKDNRPAIQLYRKFNFEYCAESFQPPIGELCYCRHIN